jgi:hypothetical protein
MKPISVYVQDVKTEVTKLKDEVENFFVQHPELEDGAKAVVTDAVTAAVNAAHAEVATATAGAPPIVATALDAAIAAAQARATDAVTKIQTDVAAEIAELEAAKTGAAPVGQEPAP